MHFYPEHLCIVNRWLLREIGQPLECVGAFLKKGPARSQRNTKLDVIQIMRVKVLNNYDVVLVAGEFA